MNYLNKLFYISCLALFAACFPKEEPIIPADRGGVTSQGIYMGGDKQDVVFYNLELDSVMATARPQDWDLYKDDGGLRINALRSVRVAMLAAEWHEKLDTQGLNFDFLYAPSSGPMWEVGDDVIYVMDMGYEDDFTTHLGYYKFMFSSQDEKLYVSPIESAFEVAADFSEGYYSILNGNSPDLPMTSEYHLAFGFYTDLVTANGVTQDYRIFGALQGGCEAIEVSDSFQSISSANFDTVTFNPDVRTNVGYDWKEYNLDKGAYDIIENKHYLLLTDRGFQYKFRFTNFYINGISGHPSFEYQLL